jgi:transposase InsO family protein
MEPRRRAASAPAGHASSADYRYRQEIALAVFTQPSTTRTAAAPKLTLPTGGGRGAGRLYRPSGSEFSSGGCVDSVTELGLRRSMGCIGSCLDNAVAESPFATLKASSSTASITASAPKREPRSSAAVGEPYRSSAGALGIAGGGRTVTDPSAPRGRPPSRRRPPSRKPKERAALLLGQAATRGASNLAAAS